MLEGVQDRAAALETLRTFEGLWEARGGACSGCSSATGEFVGEAGLMLRPDGPGAAVRYSLPPAARGRGYAREAMTGIVSFALEDGRLERVVAVLSDDNKASQALVEDFGFNLEQSFYRGRQKMLVYGLSAAFWRAQPSQTSGAGQSRALAPRPNLGRAGIGAHQRGEGANAAFLGLSHGFP